jgi:hypothetical protein
VYQWVQCISKEASESIYRHFEKILHLEIEPTLKSLQLTLEARHAILPDASEELIAFSRKMVDFTNEWCPGVLKGLGHDSRTIITPDDTFIIHCPELHPVPGNILLPSLEENSLMRRRRGSQSSVCLEQRPIILICVDADLCRRIFNF